MTGVHHNLINRIEMFVFPFPLTKLYFVFVNCIEDLSIKIQLNSDRLNRIKSIKP